MMHIVCWPGQRRKDPWPQCPWVFPASRAPPTKMAQVSWPCAKSRPTCFTYYRWSPYSWTRYTIMLIMYLTWLIRWYSIQVGTVHVICTHACSQLLPVSIERYFHEIQGTDISQKQINTPLKADHPERPTITLDCSLQHPRGVLKYGMFLVDFIYGQPIGVAWQ